ncbi:MAG: family transcriptional regulator, cyclic receptor protein [Solirubrobacteraceae bacterium]|jgi:CRP-like cAMP-binding protein|nr:family transcriptional regulator, cyclic receptor protein [Solirubrobacteraceae bacterium]
MPDSFLARLTEPELEDLRQRSRTERFARGALLLAERQVSDRVLVLTEGRVKVTGSTPAGRDAVLGFRIAGELVGEQAALDGEPRSGTVTALEPVEALAIGDARFRDYLADQPRVAMVLLELLSRRLRDADRKRIEFAAADTVGRACARLVELAERFGTPGPDGLVIDLPITQEELAGWCGASREATARALQTLRELGWIQTRRRALIVTDLEAVRARM